MQIDLNLRRLESLNRWVEYLKMFNFTNIDQVMKDALLMNDKKFYRKYKFNWWISVDDTLTYLAVMKDRNYDWYFKFIKELKI